MESIILIGIAVIAFLLWEIKKAVERPQKLREAAEEAKRQREIAREEWLTRRADDWGKRHPDAYLGDIFEAAERSWPTTEEERRQEERSK